jgi:hypothetical protein
MLSGDGCRLGDFMDVEKNSEQSKDFSTGQILLLLDIRPPENRQDLSYPGSAEKEGRQF